MRAKCSANKEGGRGGRTEENEQRMCQSTTTTPLSVCLSASTQTHAHAWEKGGGGRQFRDANLVRDETICQLFLFILAVAVALSVCLLLICIFPRLDRRCHQARWRCCRGFGHQRPESQLLDRNAVLIELALVDANEVIMGLGDLGDVMLQVSNHRVFLHRHTHKGRETRLSYKPVIDYG